MGDVKETHDPCNLILVNLFVTCDNPGFVDVLVLHRIRDLVVFV